MGRMRNVKREREREGGRAGWSEGEGEGGRDGGRGGGRDGGRGGGRQGIREVEADNRRGPCVTRKHTTYQSGRTRQNMMSVCTSRIL